MFLGAKVKIHHYWIFSPRKRIEYSERRKGKEKERYSHAITVDAPAFVTLLRCGRIQGGKETTKGKWYGRLCSIRRHCGSRRKCMRFTCWSRHCGSQCFQSRVGTGTEQKRISDHSRFISYHRWNVSIQYRNELIEASSKDRRL